MDTLSVDVKDLKEGTQRRIDGLESGKLDKAEAVKMLAEERTVHQDMETRIRRLERWILIATGFVLAVQVALTVWGNRI